MPTSYLGQNFLINETKLKEIAGVLELKGIDTVIEIGPGHGELTDKLRMINGKLRIIAIEKDKKLAADLREKFANDKNFELVEGDALKLLPQLTSGLQHTAERYKLCGNIPYYITGFLFRILGELENKPEKIVLTVQKEVAERVCAKPPKMNLLAASVQFWADAEIISIIPKKDFNPMPEVDSAVIKIIPKKEKKDINPEKYYSFIKILFKQPRKTILNNLAAGFSNNKSDVIERINELKTNPEARPQDLDIADILLLADKF